MITEIWTLARSRYEKIPSIDFCEISYRQNQQKAKNGFAFSNNSDKLHM